MANKPVDFSNPESVAAAIAEAETTEATKATKSTAPKEKKPKVIKVTWTADKDIKAGETVEFDYTLPVSATRRGILDGVSLDDMDEAQLKIEYRNANSVYYKQTKAGKDTTKSKARLDAVVEKMKEKGINVSTRAAAPVTAETIAALIASGKVDAAEIQAILDGKKA